jgi:hypothetical protein
MLFFIDESGSENNQCPYQVLAGIAIRERDLWNLLQAIESAELDIFGVRLKDYCVEFKGKKLLKTKTFRHAQELPLMEKIQRRILCSTFLQKGKRESDGGAQETRTKEEFAAYGQCVLDFIETVYNLCASYQVKIFASILVPESPKQREDFLRMDYSYLFERFFYYLEDVSEDEMGIVVFDELEKAQCRILINQMKRYFIDTYHGRVRSARVIPEPFFVHSDLTTAVQIVDIVAYCINWGLRLKKMVKPARHDIERYTEFIKHLEYQGQRIDEKDGKVWPVYGICYIEDARPRSERRRQ